MIFLPENETELHTTVQMFKHLTNCRDPFERINQIKSYLRSGGIQTVVVGISGGVDSALVLAMLNKIPDINIRAVVINFDLYNGIFDNSYIEVLKEKFNGSNIFWHEHDLTNASKHFMEGIGMNLVKPSTNANVTYAMRYLAFFAYAQECGGVTFGTTNKDEMGYAGWFGKNSDMMVDIQPISDLHKFEVLSWARILGVPEIICNRTPTGDLVDGTSDEENFGCTYDELSYFTNLQTTKKRRLNNFLEARFTKLIALHERNAHKYQGQKFNPIFL